MLLPLRIRRLAVAAAATALGLGLLAYAAPDWLSARIRTSAVALPPLLAPALTLAAIMLLMASRHRTPALTRRALPLSLRLYPAARDREREDPLDSAAVVRTVEQHLEAWSWLMGVIVMSLSAMPSGTFPVSRAEANVLLLAICSYNVTAFWLLPGLGRPRQRVGWHAAFLSVAMGFLVVVEAANGHPHLGLLLAALLVAVWTYSRAHLAVADRHAQLQQAQAEMRILNAELVLHSQRLATRRDELDQALEQVRASEAARDRLIAILEASPDLISTFNPKGQLLYLNQAARQLLRIGLGDELPVPNRLRLDTIFPPETLRLMREEIVPAAIREGVWSGETPCLLPAGRGSILSQVVVAHKAADGSVAFVSTVARDISEQKRAEHALRASVSQLQEHRRRLEELNAELLAQQETVRRLTGVAMAIAGGDLDRRAEDPGGGELSDLAQALNRMADGLKARIQEREASRRRILAAQEEVRRQVAEQLHGSVQSKLLVLWLQLRQAHAFLPDHPCAAMELIAKVQDHLNHLREDEVRGLSHRLHPSIVKMGLWPALHFLQDQFEGSLTIRLHLDPALATGDGRMEPVTLTAYRVVEEALANAIKHGRATEVSVSAACQDGNSLVLTVEDNGTGFDPHAGTEGLGLTISRDYVYALGGRFRIDSTPGQGTRLFVQLPVETTGEPLDRR